MGIALIVTSRGVMPTNGIADFLKEVLLKPLASDPAPDSASGNEMTTGDDIGLGLSQNVFRDTAAALTVIHAASGEGKLEHAAAGTRKLEVLAPPDARLASILPFVEGIPGAKSADNVLGVNAPKLPLSGPESLAGRLYSLFPAVFHSLSAQRWLTFSTHMDAITGGVLSKIDLLSAFASLPANGVTPENTRQALVDVHSFIRLLYSNKTESVVFMLLPCHLPYLQQYLIRVLRLPVERLVVDASNIEGTLRRLTSRDHFRGGSSWAGWAIRLVKADPSIAPVDLVRLVTSLHCPRLANLLLFDPVVLENLTSMHSVFRFAEWRRKPPRAEKVLLASLIPVTMLKTVTFDTSTESLSCLFRATERIAQLAPNELLTIEPPRLTPRPNTHLSLTDSLDAFFSNGAQSKLDACSGTNTVENDRSELLELSLQVLIVVGASEAQLDEAKKLKDIMFLDSRHYMQLGEKGDWSELLKKIAYSGSSSDVTNGGGTNSDESSAGALGICVIDSHLLSFGRRLELLKRLLVEAQVQPVQLVLAEPALDPRYRLLKLEGTAGHDDVTLRPTWLFNVETIICDVDHLKVTDTNTAPPLKLLCTVFEVLGCKLGPLSTSLDAGGAEPIYRDNGESVETDDAFDELACTASQRVAQEDPRVQINTLVEWLKRPLKKLILTLSASSGVSRPVAVHAVAFAAVAAHRVLTATAERHNVLIELCRTRTGPLPLIIGVATAAVITKVAEEDPSALEVNLSALAFPIFVETWSLSLVSSQLVRVGAFLHMLSRLVDESVPIDEAGDIEPSIRDLSYTILSHLDSTGNFGLANVLQPCILAGCFESNGRARSIPSYFLSTTTRNIGGEDFLNVLHGRLDYNSLTTSWANFANSAEQLCDILNAGPEPLLYLLAINVSAFVRIFVNFTILRTGLDLLKFRQLVDQVKAVSKYLSCEREFQSKEGGLPVPVWVGERLAVIKWALFCSDPQVQSVDLAFDDDDLITVLRDLNVELSVQSFNDAHLLRMLLAFDSTSSTGMETITATLGQVLVSHVNKLCELAVGGPVMLGQTWTLYAMTHQHDKAATLLATKPLFLDWARSYLLHLGTKPADLLNCRRFKFTLAATTVAIKHFLSDDTVAGNNDHSRVYITDFVTSQSGTEEFPHMMLEVAASILKEGSSQSLARVLYFFEIVLKPLIKTVFRDNASNVIGSVSNSSGSRTRKLAYGIWTFINEIDVSRAKELLSLARELGLSWPFKMPDERAQQITSRVFAAALPSGSNASNAIELWLENRLDEQSSLEFIETCLTLVRKTVGANDDMNRLSDDELGSRLHLSTAAFGVYPTAGFCPPAWIWLQTASDQGHSKYCEWRDCTREILEEAACKTSLDRKDIKRLSSFAKCVFCPSAAPPSVLDAYVKVFYSSNAKVLFQVCGKGLTLMQFSIHNPAERDAWNKCRLGEQICARLADSICEPPANDTADPNSHYDSIIKDFNFSHGASLEVLDRNFRAYTALLCRCLLAVCIEDAHSEASEEDDKRTQTVKTLLMLAGGLWLFHAWFGSFGTAPSQLPIKNIEAPEFMMKLLSELIQNAPTQLDDWFNQAINVVLQRVGNEEVRAAEFVGCLKIDDSLLMQGAWILQAHESSHQIFADFLSSYIHTIGLLVGYSGPALARVINGHGNAPGWTWTEYRTRSQERHCLIQDTLCALIEVGNGRDKAHIWSLASGFANAIAVVLLEIDADKVQAQIDKAWEQCNTEENAKEFLAAVADAFRSAPKCERISEGAKVLQEQLFALTPGTKFRKKKADAWDLQKMVEWSTTSESVVSHKVQYELLRTFVLDVQSDQATHRRGNAVEALEDEGSVVATKPSIAGSAANQYRMPHGNVMSQTPFSFRFVATQSTSIADGFASTFDSADRQQVADMSTHTLLSDGNNVIDGRQLLRWDDIATDAAVAFELINVVDGQECFLVLHRAGTITDRCDSQPAACEAGCRSSSRLFNFMEVVDHVDMVTPQDEVLLTFPSFRECWLFLDRTCGSNTLVVLDGLSLHRRNQQAWEGVNLNLTFAPAKHRLDFVFVHRDLCKLMPECVFEVASLLLDAETLQPKFENWFRRMYPPYRSELGSAGDGISREEVEKALESELPDEMWTNDRSFILKNVVLVLAHPKWLAFLLGIDSVGDGIAPGKQPPASDPFSYLSDILKPLPVSKGYISTVTIRRMCDLHNDTGPESAADEDCSDDSDSFGDMFAEDDVTAPLPAATKVFCDLFRERKDVQVSHANMIALPVAIIFERRVLINYSHVDQMSQWVLDVLSAPLLRQTKFLFLYVLTHGKDTVGTNGLCISEQDTFIAVSLASCCPEKNLRRALNNLVNPFIQQDLQGLRTLLERRDYRYGVVTCGDVLKKLDKYDLLAKAVQVIDVDAETSRDEALYLRIISIFDSNCHIVYVRGLPLASDIFLK